MISLLWAAAALAAPVGLDRVDLIAEGPGTFVNYDLPMLGTSTTRSAVRFVEQVQPVWRLPVDGLYVGTSITSQSLIYERAVLGPITASAALETSLLLPRGLRAGVAWRGGPVRVALGVSALTPSGWGRVDYNTWTVMPTVGVGVVRRPRHEDLAQSLGGFAARYAFGSHGSDASPTATSRRMRPQLGS